MGEGVVSPKLKTLLLVFGLVALLVLLPFVLPSYYIGLTSRALIMGILAMSVNLLLGHLGFASVGHAAFFGIASYTVAIISRNVEGAVWSAMGMGLLTAFLAGALFGPLAIRTRDIFFLVIMLAFCQICFGIAFSWQSLTGGEDGLPGLSRPLLFPGVSLEEVTSYYIFVSVVFLLVTAGYWLLVSSPFGLALRGIRDSESRMKILGYNVWLYRYLAFLISAFIAGIAGILNAYFDGCPNPGDFSVVNSSSALLMVILGGPGTLLGPLIGSVIIVFLRDIVSSVTARWSMFLGLAYVLAVLFLPDGCIGVFKKKLESDKATTERQSSGEEGLQVDSSAG